MSSNRFFLFEVYRNIKWKLPHYVIQAIFRLIPIYLISSIFEIFGLFVLFPLIKVILDPSLIQTNKYLNRIYEALHFNSNISLVLFLFCSVTLLFVLKNFLIYLISKKQITIAYKLASRLSLEKYNSYLGKPYSFHADSNTALLLRNFTQIPFELINYCVLPFIALVNEMFIITLIIGTIALYDPLLFFSLVLFTAPFLLIYNKFYKKKLKNISSSRDEESASMFKIGLQSMEAFREITVFDKKNYFKPMFKKIIDKYSKSMSETYLMNSFSPKFVETVAVLAIFSIFISGYILNKDLTALAQFLIIFAIAAFRIIPSLNKIILSSNYIKSSSYIFQHFEITTEEVINRESVEFSDPIEFKEKLEIRELSFSFNNQKGNILNNLNLVINKGQTIGIIGSSGAGKSTLLNILLRLYEEKSGGIYIDGTKIEKYMLGAWYQLISYVPQNITLLDGSIMENIAFGINTNKINIDLLNYVIKQSQLENFINELPEGQQTQIGEKGIKISGGQRQRIGIARALYHGGKILIFDEATSSLDSETEEMLTEAINNISNKEFTVIIVAHRIQTLKYCDAVYKLENGEIKLD
ncbi:MAG: transporter ATP-binding protein [Bacteroidota bacterium]|jgi:ABC-type multidrug transport system fused ATPase/permease subunit|nr:transporter ATP-binding protein [Bacteroidota bacterium]